MKWSVSLIALCAALTTASPTPGKTIDFSKNNHGATFTHDKRQFCTIDDKEYKECCCSCAGGAHWPCIGCKGVSSVHFILLLFSELMRGIVDDILP